MRALLLILMLATAPALPGRAQGPGMAIEDVIASQIEAFKADDFATAFEFASPHIRRLFGTPERFGAMVREGYPMVWRPADVQFSGRIDRDGSIYQGVIFTDRAGVLHILDYEMVLIGGRWRINGVFPRPETGV